MPTTVQNPSFSGKSYLTVQEIERRVRDRTYALLEEKLRKESRERITEEDVMACMRQAMQEVMESLL